jgi:hypothetical protein
VILNNNHLVKVGARNKAKGASGNSNTRYIKRVTSLYNTFLTLELVSKPYGVPSTPV